MTGGWNDFNPRQRQAAEHMFGVLSTMGTVCEAIEEERPRCVGFSDLYTFATNPDVEMSPALEAALQQNGQLEKDLTRLLEKTAGYHFPKAAAASTGAIARRDGDLYRISLRPSRADSNQVYVVIDLSDVSAVPPQTLYVCRPGRACEKHRLPVAHDGTIQILADAASGLVEGLQDHAAEVFLR